jgi:hypothetical protein
VARISRETFNFSQDFQDLILACVLRRAEFREYASVLSYKYFSGVVSTKLARKIFKYHKEYAAFPGKEEVIQMAVENAKGDGEPPEKAVAYVERLFKMKTGGWKDVHKKVITFCRERAVLAAITTSIEFFKKGEEPPGGYSRS